MEHVQIPSFDLVLIEHLLLVGVVSAVVHDVVVDVALCILLLVVFLLRLQEVVVLVLLGFIPLVNFEEDLITVYFILAKSRLVQTTEIALKRFRRQATRATKEST